MIVRRAKLIPDTEVPLDDGLTKPPPVRAKIRLDDGKSVQAIIKRLPPKETAVECFCSALLHGWGIPTPPIALIEEENEYIFASLDTAYPSLKKRFGITADIGKPESAKRAMAAAEIVSTWDETPRVIAIDEAISNKDRNLGNILWDGDTRSYIDHASALNPSAIGINKLAGLMFALGKYERIEKSAVAACFTLAQDTITNAVEDLPETWLEYKNEFENFVSNQLPQLANKVIACFPKPQKDLLTP